MIMAFEGQPLPLTGLLKSVNHKTKFATQKVYPTTKVHSNISAGFVIFHMSERGLIKKLDGVAPLIIDRPPTNFPLYLSAESTWSLAKASIVHSPGGEECLR